VEAVDEFKAERDQKAECEQGGGSKTDRSIEERQISLLLKRYAPCVRVFFSLV
jgi:hypothetical protein